MVREFQSPDLDEVAKIWLDSNIEAHHFISAEYWKSNFAAVKEMFFQAEVYVYENEETGHILGFIGLYGDDIAGIFVCRDKRSGGIGKQLLDFVKRRKAKLSLSVYQKNVRAVKFYQKENFRIEREETDRNTQEKEYRMIYTAQVGS